VIELGGLLGQLPPLLVGAWALAVKKKQKFLPWIYLTGLACALVAIRINCSRIALLSAPALSALIFLVNFKAFGLRTKIYAFILAIFAVGFLFSDTTVTGRVKEMFVAKGNLNNDMRLGLWHYGWEVFKKHPVLGVGPGAIERPNVKEVFSQEYESIISFPNQYLHVHQSFINALAESGVPGLVTFLAVLLIPLIYLRKNLFTSDAELFFWSWSALASFLQFIFNGLTDNLFTIKPLNYVFWTIIASALWLASNRRTDEATKALAAKKSKPFRLILG
jgi:O-antigen ligase